MSLRRRGSTPLATDSASPPDLPPLRMGLLAKLNLLTIGLIFLTAIATTGFHVWQEWRDKDTELRQRGSATLAMLAELAEFGLSTNNRAFLEAILENLSAESDVAYAVIVDSRREPVAFRRIAESIGTAGPPAASDVRFPAPGAVAATDLTVGGRAVRRADCAGRRHEALGRAGARPASGGSTAGCPSSSARRDADRLCPPGNDIRAAAAGVPQVPGGRAVGRRVPDHPDDRRDAAAHPRPRRADAPAHARGTRGGRRRARRLRPRVRPTSLACSPARSTT